MSGWEPLGFVAIILCVCALAFGVLVSIPPVFRAAVLAVFGAGASDIRRSEIIHRAARGNRAYEVFLFPVATAPKLAVALARAVRRSDDEGGNACLDSQRLAWAAWLMYGVKRYRRLDADVSLSLIEALAKAPELQPGVVEEYLGLIADDPAAGAAYLCTVGNVEKAIVGWGLGVAPEYAAVA